MNYLMYILAALIVLAILKWVFKKSIKTIIKVAINIFLGGLILFFINYLPFITIEINIINSLIVGFLGVPGAIALIVYYLIVK